MSVGDAGIRSGPTIERSAPRLRFSIHSIPLVTAGVDLAIVVLSAVVSAVVYHAIVLRSGVNLEPYAAIGAVCFLNFAVIAGARRAYQVDALLRVRRQARETAATWAVVMTVSLTFVFAAKLGENISRGAIASFFVVGVIGLVAWRGLLGLWLARALETGALGTKPVVLIADEYELSHTDTIRQIGRVGFTAATTLTYESSASGRALQDLVDKAVQVAKDEPIDSIMVLANWSNAAALEQVARSLRILPLPVYLLPDHFTALLLTGGIDAIAGLTAAAIQRAPLTIAERAAKRAFDLILATAGLVLLAPLFVIVALLIKVNTRGPVFFRQSRVGFNGRSFRILKFRSMNVDEDGETIRQATRGDVRVTTFGRWLRRTNIDELPQLWNVLKGDMSIVGPRPHAVAHDVEYQKRIGNYAYRRHVKPGLTGWAQVNGLRGETKTIDLMERRIAYDLHYIDHWTIFFDVLIVLLTIRLGLRDPAAF